MRGTFSIIGGTLYGNHGAEMMLSVVVGRLRDKFPGSKFNILSYLARDDRLECTDGSLIIYSASPLALVLLLFPGALIFGLLKRAFGNKVLRLAPSPIRALGESDYLLDIAGVSFVDGRERFLPFNILTLWPGMLLGVPVIKLSQAIGPIQSPLNRFGARLTLPYCTKIWARGQATYANLVDAGISKASIERADDLAFLYTQRYCLTRRSEQLLKSFKDWHQAVRSNPQIRATVGICPSSILGGQSIKSGPTYEQRIASLATDLMSDGFAVFVFPNATRSRSGNKEHNNDLPLIARITERIAQTCHGSPSPRTAYHIIDGDINSQDIVELVRLSDILVVSRFHAMVTALAQCTPVVTLGWHHKYSEVMRLFDLEWLVYPSNQQGDPMTVEFINLVWAKHDDINTAIEEKIGAIIDSASRQLELSIPPTRADP